MHFRSLLSLLVGLFAWNASALSQSNTVGTIAYNPELYSAGYTLVYPHNQPHARLLNACGEVVHIWTNDSLRRPGNSAYLMPNGNLIWTHRSAAFLQDPMWAGGGGAVIEARNWNNEVLWNFTLNDSTGRLHHDFAMTPSGTVLAIAWERIDSLSAIEAGRDPALLEDGELWSERIIELQPNGDGGADVIWEWRVWDHLVQDFDATKSNFGEIASAPHLVDVNFGTPSQVLADWLHMNSIDYSFGLNHILVSVPTFDELWMIDKGNPEAGLIWRWGNPEAHGMGTSENQQLHYQHAANWLDAPFHQGSPDFGKIAVFNNRNPGETGPFSSAHLIDPMWSAEDSSYSWGDQQFAPATFDWTWTAPVPTDFFSSGLSNFERLPNGNNLITSGRTGEIFEFTPAGDTAWYYRIPLAAGIPVAQGTELGINDNLFFEGVRYPAQFPAFANADLSPMGHWELDPVPVLGCQPCTLGAEIIASGGSAYVEVDGAIGAYDVLWILDDVTLCGGDTLSEASENAECAEVAAALINGEIIHVFVTDANSCTAELEFNWISNLIAERGSLVSIYPNPAQASVTIAGMTGITEVDLYSLAGTHVASFATINGSSQQSLSLDGIPYGLYLLSIAGELHPLIIQAP